MAKHDIREHMQVLGSDGQHVGVVDRVEGGKHIKLTRSDPAADGLHHVIPLEWVERVDQAVHLKKSSHEAKREWKPAA
jgi:hypothetical protein